MSSYLYTNCQKIIDYLGGWGLFGFSVPCSEDLDSGFAYSTLNRQGIEMPPKLLLLAGVHEDVTVAWILDDRLEPVTEGRDECFGFNEQVGGQSRLGSHLRASTVQILLLAGCVRQVLAKELRDLGGVDTMRNKRLRVMFL